MARSFYSDDETVNAVPGISQLKMSKEAEKKESLNEVDYIDNMPIRSTPYLESLVHQSRKFLYVNLSVYGAEWETQKSAFWNEYASLKNLYKDVVVEPVLPNLLNILTATLGSSILVNRRSLPVRFVVPLLTGGTSYYYFMPKSFENSRQLAMEFEKQYPQVWDAQQQSIGQLCDLKKSAQSTLAEANQELVRQVGVARKYLIDTIN